METTRKAAESTRLPNANALSKRPLSRPRQVCPGEVRDGTCLHCGATGIPGMSGWGTWPHEPATTPPPVKVLPRHAKPSLSTPAPRRPLFPSLGGGVVSVPPVAYRDPLSALLDSPSVAEEVRFCATCQAPIGRGSAKSKGPDEGRCYACGTAFSFTPPLNPGDVVGIQYEVVGCLAYGGQGWIYLAKDHNVSDRWVVLKGIIHAGSQAAAAAALAEQRFLAEVQHQNIVQIYNFVWHEPTRTSYIVMEYLGGPTLQDIALHRYHTSGRTEALPIAQVIAYGLELLRTLSYLHGHGLLYCDLKPSNIIQLGDRIKLIDLGGVRWQNDSTTPMIHTDGFAAPELSSRGASISSDLYALARTLAALTMDFDASGELREPPPGKTMESEYLRVLHWTTSPDPAQRPQSADEMAEYLAAALYV